MLERAPILMVLRQVQSIELFEVQRGVTVNSFCVVSSSRPVYMPGNVFKSERRSLNIVHSGTDEDKVSATSRYTALEVADCKNCVWKLYLCLHCLMTCVHRALESSSQWITAEHTLIDRNSNPLTCIFFGGLNAHLRTQIWVCLNR